MRTSILLKSNLLFLIVILFLGLFLRIIFINNSPPSLYGDELTIALDSHSLLKTGRDQLGNFLPLTFPMGAGRPAGYVYGSIPFMALFGPSALGVRMLSVLSGLGIIVLLYLIGKKLCSPHLGILAAAIGAFSPWDISLSRAGYEAHFALFLALLGTYLFMMARYRPILYLLAALSFGLTLHTYPTYKVSLLFFLPLLFWYEGGVKGIFKRKHFLLAVIVFLALGILSLSQTFIGGSEKRFADINILSQGKLKDTVEQKINLERPINSLPDYVSKYFHNKPVEYSKVLIENYLQNFSVDFFILHGDRNPRHNMATMGELYLIDTILIIIGVLIFWQRYKSIIKFLILWILVAPIPTAIIDLPHALRSSFMLPPLIILSALGLSAVLSFKNRILSSGFLLLFIVQFVFFLQKLYFLSPNEYSNFWSYPAKLASEIALKEKSKFNYVVISDKIDNMEFAYPVYAKSDPLLLISQNRSKTLLEGYKFKRFDNVYIGYIPDNEVKVFLDNLKGSVLYLGPISDAKLLQDYQTVDSLDNTRVLVSKRK